MVASVALLSEGAIVGIVVAGVVVVLLLVAGALCVYWGGWKRWGGQEDAKVVDTTLTGTPEIPPILSSPTALSGDTGDCTPSLVRIRIVTPAPVGTVISEGDGSAKEKSEGMLLYQYKTPTLPQRSPLNARRPITITLRTPPAIGKV